MYNYFISFSGDWETGPPCRRSLPPHTSQPSAAFPSPPWRGPPPPTPPPTETKRRRRTWTWSDWTRRKRRSRRRRRSSPVRPSRSGGPSTSARSWRRTSRSRSRRDLQSRQHCPRTSWARFPPCAWGPLRLLLLPRTIPRNSSLLTLRCCLLLPTRSCRRRPSCTPPPHPPLRPPLPVSTSRWPPPRPPPRQPLQMQTLWQILLRRRRIPRNQAKNPRPRPVLPPPPPPPISRALRIW